MVDKLEKAILVLTEKSLESIDASEAKKFAEAAYALGEILVTYSGKYSKKAAKWDIWEVV